MVKHKHSKKKRVQAALMSCVMTLSTLAGTFGTAMPVHAAAPTNGPQAGQILISWVDSSVYGADRTDATITQNMYAPVRYNNVGGYWDNSLSNYDFLYSEQGFASMKGREFVIYDLGDSATAPAADKNPGDSNEYYTTTYLDGLVTQGKALRGAAMFTGKHSGIITERDLVNGHKLVIVEDNGANNGYYTSVEENMNGKGWQAIITYDSSKSYNLQYDKSTVKSLYNTSEPMHNEVYRGGFKFSIDDKDIQIPGRSQGAAKLNDAVFAVYNINFGSDEHPSTWSEDGTKTGGFVIADRNNDGVISKYDGTEATKNAEQLQYIPAYHIDTITAAYNAYLENGAKYTDSESNGEFIIGKTAGGKNIVPVMTLKPNEHGVVETSKIALPAGNYMIVQVKAGKGYFIDEDFRPVVSIGRWDNQGSTGYSDTFTTLIPEDGYASNITGGRLAPNGVAYCPIGEITDISSLNPSFTINGNRYVANGNDAHITYTVADGQTLPSGGANGIYAQAEGKYLNSTPRLAPIVGQSKMIAHNTVIRGEATMYLADSDDIKAENRVENINISNDGKYMIVPQGNGVLDGSKFQIVSSTTQFGSGGYMQPIKVDGKTYNRGDGPVYTVTNGAINIPTDALPYGLYELKQLTFGEGYVENPETIGTMAVDTEDTIKCSPKAGVDPGDINKIGNSYYLTNILVDGGELYKITSTSTEDVEVKISVYNISDHYVYVSPDGTSAEKRYETIKDLYEDQIKGKTFTVEEINELLKDQDPCKTYEIQLNETENAVKTLPYGEYLMVISELPTGYTLTGNSFAVDGIDKNGDTIKFTANVEKTTVEPERELEIKTEFFDAEYGIDSIRCDDDVVMYDHVDVAGLDGGVTYTAYGVMVDMATGEIYAPGNIAYTRFTTYKSTSDADKDRDGTASFDMHFDYIDTSKVENKTIVAYEYICADNVDIGDSVNGVVKPNTNVAKAKTIAELNMALDAIGVIGAHRSLADEAQTGYVAGLDIDAIASYSEGKLIDPSETVKATVDYSNVEIGNDYRIVMSLYDEHENPIVDVNGVALTITKDFKAVNTYGDVEGVFEGLDVAKYNDQRLTVYADLYRVYSSDANKSGVCKLITKGDADSMGYDVTDEDPGKNQIDVVTPDVKTVLTDKFGAKEVDFSRTVTLTDTVDYSNLVPGGVYRSVFTLVDKDGNTITDDNGAAITTTVEFTATAETATVKLPVTFLGTKLEDSQVVAFNDLYRVTAANTKLVGSEHDTTIAEQTVTGINEIEITKPVIETIFTDNETGVDSIPCVKDVTLTDKILVKNAVIGQEYSIYSAVVDLETGDLYKDGLITFTNATAIADPNVLTGSTNIANKLANMIAQGEAMTYADSDKMVWLNEVETYNSSVNNMELAGYIDNAKAADTEAKFEDYKVKVIGALKVELNKLGVTSVELGGIIDADVYFNVIDMRDVESKTLVAFEYLCTYSENPIDAVMNARSISELTDALYGKVIVAHESLKDEDQTVRTAELDIEAKAHISGDKVIDPSENVKAIVSYGNLELGETYRIEMRLYDESGALIDGQTKSETFVARHVEGTVETDFEGLDVVKYNGQRLTVYSDIYRVYNDTANRETEVKLITKGDADSMDWTITNKEPGKNQVDVKVPTIKTVLADQYGDKTVDFDVNVKLVDTITYKDLIPGVKYRSVLTLVNKDGTVLCADNGKEITATLEFTSNATEMEIKIPVEFLATKVVGMDIVAYNDLYRMSKQSINLVASEHDLESVDQTISAEGEASKITISTVAIDPTSQSHTIPAISAAQAKDTVTITGLEPKTKYTYVTEIADAETGRVIPQITAIETAVNSDENGEARFTVDLQVNAKIFIGKRIVVYGTLYDANKREVLAEHKDKNNANQTLIVPSLDTIATLEDGTTKTAPIDDDVIIQDLVTYTGLNPGQTYTLVSEVVMQDGTGQSLAKVTKEFTPDATNGKIVVKFTVDTTKLEGKQVVVTQLIKDTYTSDEIITHNDLDDADQTITVKKTEEPTDDPDPEDPTNPKDPDNPGPGKNIQTGVAENSLLFFILALVSALVAACGVGYMIYDKKKSAVKVRK